MGIETGTKIADLNANWPLGTDPRSQGDDHLRLIKSIMKGDALSKAAGGTVQGALTLEGGSPALRFRETDAASPNGQWVINGYGEGALQFGRYLGADFTGTFQQYMRFFYDDGTNYDRIFIDMPVAGPLVIKSSAPEIRFRETDAPAGRTYRFAGLAAGNLQCQVASAEDFTVGVENIWYYTPTEQFVIAKGAVITGTLGDTATLKLTNGYPAIWFQDTSPTGSFPNLYFTAGNSNMRVGPGDAAGGISAAPWATINSTSGWVAGSDARLKHDIVYMDDESVIDTIMALLPARFVWNDTGLADIGLIAQDVRHVVPAAVGEMPDTEGDGNEPLLSLRDRPLVTLLVRALQELVGEVRALRDRVERLEAGA